MTRLTPRDLAQAFVRRVVQDVFGDFPNLTERERTGSCYKAIEDAVRRRGKVPAHDLLRLEEAVKQAVPEPYRGDLAFALNALSNAFTDELIVHEHTAYLVGLTVGQTCSTLLLPDSLPDLLDCSRD